MSTVLLVALVLLGVVVAAAAIYLVLVVRAMADAVPTILREGPDGKLEVVATKPVLVGKNTGPHRSYVVREDGTLEYSDGEVIDPDKTKINPPDMRMMSDEDLRKLERTLKLPGESENG